MEMEAPFDGLLYQPIERPAPSWLVNSIGRALHRYRRGQAFESRTSLNFFRLSSIITAMMFFHVIVSLISSTLKLRNVSFLLFACRKTKWDQDIVISWTQGLSNKFPFGCEGSVGAKWRTSSLMHYLKVGLTDITNIFLTNINLDCGLRNTNWT